MYILVTARNSVRRAGQSKADQQFDTNITCCSVRWRELVLRRLMKVLYDPVERWLQQHNGLVGSRGEDPAGAGFFSRGKTGFPGLAVALPKTSLRAARRGLMFSNIFHSALSTPSPGLSHRNALTDGSCAEDTLRTRFVPAAPPQEGGGNTAHSGQPSKRALAVAAAVVGTCWFHCGPTRLL